MEHGGNGGTILRRVLLTPGAPLEGTERLISVCDATQSQRSFDHFQHPFAPLYVL